MATEDVAYISYAEAVHAHIELMRIWGKPVTVFSTAHSSNPHWRALDNLLYTVTLI